MILRSVRGISSLKIGMKKRIQMRFLEYDDGSPNRIRTYDLPVNSRLLYRWAIGEDIWLPE